jgi:hypothetical protein
LTTFIDHRRSGCSRQPPDACEGNRHFPANARSLAGRASGRYRRSITDRSKRQKRCSTTPARLRPEVGRNRRQKDQTNMGAGGLPKLAGVVEVYLQ